MHDELSNKGSFQLINTLEYCPNTSLWQRV